MTTRTYGVLLVLAAVAVIAVWQSGVLDPKDAGRQRHYVPSDVADPPWLDERAQAQLATASTFGVFHDFSFEDRREESGITFRHKIVDDVGRDFRMVHYDHGNGVSIADVDGDGLYDILFLNQVGSNGLWRNLGDGAFENFTDAAGIGLEDKISVAASFADTDNDGDPDLYITTVRYGNVLFENDGTGRFTDISADSGVDYRGHSSGAVFFDYDRDGLLDLFLTNVGTYTSTESAPIRGLTRFDKLEGSYEYYPGVDRAFQGHLIPSRFERNVLFRNLGNNTFDDVSSAVGLVDSSWSGDASPIDVNEDGWTDLYILSMQGRDQYFESVEGERFVRKSESIFPATPWGAMGVKVFDFNNDGRLDLYITDMHSDMWETSQFFDYRSEKKRPAEQNVPAPRFLGSFNNVYGNALFRNDAPGRFVEVAVEMNAETYWPWGHSVGDLNADGYDDIFVTASMSFPFRYQVNSVLLNNRGEGFLDSEFVLGVEPRRENQTATLWFELNCDEIEVGRGICQSSDSDERYDVWGAIGSRSSVIFDLDNDGDLDIVTNDFNSVPLVLVSDLSNRTTVNFLNVELVGRVSNRNGLGAVVTVRSDGASFVKVYDGVSGYLSHSLYPLHFGLGGLDVIDQLEVRWPSGRKQIVEGPIKANQTLTIVEE